MGVLQPDGETGALLDALEKRALFQLLRQTGLALMRALPGAVVTLRGIAEAVVTLGEADEPMRDDQEDEKLRIAQVQMLPKLLEQKRVAALSLFTLAKELELFTLAKAYRAPDIEADEEAELQRMAEAQGLAYLPPLNTLNTTEPPLRRVK